MPTARFLRLPPVSSLRYKPDPANLRASLVVFLVAIPLSLGIAVASGAPVAAGLIAAIVGGVVVGLFGGIPLQVSGPAAGLTVIVADLVSRFGWRATCLVTLCAGLLQLVMGATRVARWVIAVSPAVVHGMLAGIGVTITLSQVHVVLGGEPHAGAMESLVALPSQLAEHHPPAMFVGLSVIAVLLLWPRLPKKVQVVPGALAAVAFGTIFAAAADLTVTNVQLPSDIGSWFTTPALPDEFTWPVLLVAIATVAVVASTESLLSAMAVERLASNRDGTARRGDLDRELVGQGLANSISGVLGGLPVTGVIVRSSAAIAAGATGRSTAVLHAVWIATFAVLAAGLIELIPLAALAGLLVVVGLRLVNLAHVRELHRHRELVVYAGTLGGVVVFDLLRGVALGVAIATILMLKRAVWSNVRLERDGESVNIRVSGALSFLALPRLMHVLHEVREGDVVTLYLVVDYLDHATFDCIDNWRTMHEAGGGRVVIREIGDAWEQRMREPSASVRRRAIDAYPRWLASWSRWEEMRSGPRKGNLQSGTDEFNRKTAPLMREVFQGLALGQSPDVMFIGCSDSRVVPNILTSSGPGDLFTLSNVGNVVPLPDSTDVSVAAALDYAITRLQVKSIVVCGHSDCGAMQTRTGGDGDSALGSWLEHTSSDQGAGLDEPARRNVVMQLQNLSQHRVVAEAVAAGRLSLVGMYFDLVTARILTYDPSVGRFEAEEEVQIQGS